MIERYSRPVMQAMWDDQNRMQKWLDVELAICEGWAELGVVPKDAVARMRDRATFDVQAVKERERVTRHDVAAFVGLVQAGLGDDGRWLHYGVTSSDVVDTALALLMTEAVNVLLADLEALLARVRDLAVQHAWTVMVGRTHGVHAEPITMGLKLLLWYEELKRQRRRLQTAREEIRVGKISGAVGTHATLDPRVEAHACRILGLEPAPISSQVLQRDRHAAYMAALANLGGTLDKMALEFRHLQRTEVLEAQEGFFEGQKGSSAMPHKRNPVNFEQICGLARLLRSYAQAAFEDQALWHERDISHSSVERVIVPDATILLDYMLAKMCDLLQNVVFFPEHMQRNLDATRGLVYSQRVLLALIERGMSRDDAYVAVQRAAREVWERGRTFRDALTEQPEVQKHLQVGAVDDLLEPRYYLRYIPELYARAGITL
ncbi:MAG: adenylosuccinate lyase [Candidatus Xenobia bacterium]